MKLMKLDDEQLSRILTAHANGELYYHGGYNWEIWAPGNNRSNLGGCALQYAFNLATISETVYLSPDFVRRFDLNYRRTMTFDELLELLTPEFRGRNG